MDLKKSQNDIVKIGLWINIILLVIGLFYKELWILNMGLLANLTLMGTHWVITKYYSMFQKLLGVNHIAKTLDNKLGKIHG